MTGPSPATGRREGERERGKKGERGREGEREERREGGREIRYEGWEDERRGKRREGGGSEMKVKIAKVESKQR